MRFIRLIFFTVLACSFAVAGYAAERETPIVKAVAAARDAVVNIRTEKIMQRSSRSFFGFGDSIFDQFFHELLPPSRSYKTESLGSGVIIDSSGHILTNAHVVDKASRIFVATADTDRELMAKLVGQDSRIDLAVLKIVEDGSYPFLAPARSDDLMLGETVIAIGNPLGFGHSITTGIVSSTKRRVQLSEEVSSVFIQTDALINPGNSGGPLININGELIGINTAIARQAQGIGFSIPIDIAKRVVSDLIAYGRVRHPYLGIIVGEVSRSFVLSHGEGGVLIEDVSADGPGLAAGLQVADVILAVDGVPLSSVGQYYAELNTYTPGDVLSITLLRGDHRISASVTLSSLPAGYQMAYTRNAFGFSVRQERSGLVIDDIVAGAAADRVGLKPGDFVVKVENQLVETVAQFELAIEERLGRKSLQFTVVRDSVAYLVELP